MMHPFTPARLRLPLAGLALVVAALSFGCCDCEDLTNLQSIEHVGTIAKVEKIEVVGTAVPDADHWLVIHDKVEPVTNEQGDWIGCASEPKEDNVAYLPECLHVKQGDSIGFVNYSKTDVTIKHFLTIEAPNPFSLGSGETKTFPVIVSNKNVLVDIKSENETFDHGGPEMIVQP